jgi:hypothetical protein
MIEFHYQGLKNEIILLENRYLPDAGIIVRAAQTLHPMKVIRILKSTVVNLHFLFFINGFLLCLFVNFQMANNYEKRIFSSLARNIAAETENMPEDSVLTHVLHATNSLISSRSSIFHPGTVNPASTTADFATSLTGDLMTGQGACGSYSKVMVGIAKKLGYECRIGQMKVNGLYGGHIIPEIHTANGWVVVDPMYNLAFVNAEGKHATFQEVSSNWDYYKHQVPANYNHDYRYEAVRYTNWDKVPVVLPMMKKALDFSIGKQRADAISIRVDLLSIYNIYSFILLLLIIPLSIFLVTKVVSRKRHRFYSEFNWETSRFPVLARILVKTDKSA